MATPVSIAEETLAYDDGSVFNVSIIEYRDPLSLRVTLVSEKNPIQVYNEVFFADLLSCS